MQLLKLHLGNYFKKVYDFTEVIKSSTFNQFLQK